MKISIIIPVYNVSRYIRKCIESVLAQTYPDWEAIIVDDCGSDDSMAVAYDVIGHSSLSARFKFARHERNRGLSAARNTGSAMAGGDYLLYVDSDDYIAPDCLEKLAAPLARETLDFVIGDYSVIDGSPDGIPGLLLDEGSVRTNEDVLRLYTHGLFYMMAWNKLISRDFLNRNGLSFKEGLIHEDDLWSFEIACCASSFAVVRAKTYMYVVRANSIQTTQKKDEEIDRVYTFVSLMEEFAVERGFIRDNRVFHFLERAKTNLVGQSLLIWNTERSFALYRRIRSLSHKGFLSLRNYKWWLREAHYLLPARLGFYYLRFFLSLNHIRNKEIVLENA